MKTMTFISSIESETISDVKSAIGKNDIEQKKKRRPDETEIHFSAGRMIKTVFSILKNH